MDNTPSTGLGRVKKRGPKISSCNPLTRKEKESRPLSPWKRRGDGLSPIPLEKGGGEERLEAVPRDKGGATPSKLEKKEKKKGWKRDVGDLAGVSS